MASNNFFRFEDGMVVCKEKTYEVEFEDFKKIKIPEEHARKIALSCNLNVSDVVTFLAYIEYARSETNAGKGRKRRKIPVDTICEVLTIFLRYSGIETITEKVRQIKYHQIQAVFYSEDPIHELEKFI